MEQQLVVILQDETTSLTRRVQLLLADMQAEWRDIDRRIAALDEEFAAPQHHEAAHTGLSRMLVHAELLAARRHRPDAQRLSGPRHCAFVSVIPAGAFASGRWESGGICRLTWEEGRYDV